MLRYHVILQDKRLCLHPNKLEVVELFLSISENLKLPGFSSSSLQTVCMFLQAVRHSHMQMDTAHLFLLAQISFSSCRQTTSSPMLAWFPLLFSQASVFRPSCLPGFPFRFTGKHSLAFPLAWILLFASQASILSLFRLPRFRF